MLTCYRDVIEMFIHVICVEYLPPWLRVKRSGNPGEYHFNDKDDVEYPSFDDVITDENSGNN